MNNPNIAPLHHTDTKNLELSWFSQMVERGRNGTFTEVVTITPEIAERLLERNEGNRNINEAQVAAIAKDISSGFWQLNGETIIVSRDGFLNDGQNRLTAVIRAGEPIQSAMVFGVSRESRMSVDMGRQRRASDFMKMNGVCDSFRMSALVTLHSLYKMGCYGRNPSTHGKGVLTKQDILAAYEARKKQFDAAHDIFAHKSVKGMGPSSIGTAYMIIKELNTGDCEVFFDRLMDGANLSRNSPILALRNKLLNQSSRLFSHERLELILRTWNAWRDGRDNGKCPPLRGAYPKVSR
jgi:hypothetical protein